MTALRKYLKRKSITFKGFAQHMDISQNSAGNIINGKHLPSLPLAYKIQGYTQGVINLSSWFTGEESEINEEIVKKS